MTDAVLPGYNSKAIFREFSTLTVRVMRAIMCLQWPQEDFCEQGRFRLSAFLHSDQEGNNATQGNPIGRVRPPMLELFLSIARLDANGCALELAEKAN